MNPSSDNLAVERPEQWVSRVERLHTAVLADVLDRLGSRAQAMRPEIRPLFPGARAAGFALTVKTIPATEVPAEPYKGEMAAVDALKTDDLMIVSSCDWSFWGELLSTAARFRGCRGVVIDGYTRDSRAITEMTFPVFCRGTHPADSLGRLDVEAHGVPIHCGGVSVETGDLVLADDDGVVVIPRALAAKVLDLAEAKVHGENLVRSSLAEGMPVTEAFRRYGIL
ncbi:MAG: 4-carboxy-4-hydroxy-2-oxoadipate aldolase/oxaloacetate decarboxylase [Isosphaeraceae bacterium]